MNGLRLLSVWLLFLSSPSFATGEREAAALFQAARKGDIELVRNLLDTGIDVQATDKSYGGDEQTALHHAIRAQDSRVVRLLLDRGANVNARATTGYTPLHVAAGLGKVEHARVLLSSRANANAMDSRGTPLHAATLQGHAGMVDLLLNAGADPNARAPDGDETPLTLLGNMLIYMDSHDRIIRRLVEARADVNARNKLGRRPIEGLYRAKEETIFFLLDNGADSRGAQINGRPITFAYAESGSQRVLERFFALGHAVDERSSDGATLLHYAARRGRLNIVGLLMTKGVDVNVRSRSGATPLHEAAFERNDEMVASLLKLGADPNAADQEGRTPVFRVLASPDWKQYDLKGAIRVVGLLKSAGAKMDVFDNQGSRPLNWLVLHGDVSNTLEVPVFCELAYQVIVASGNPNLASANGDTALHSLARRRSSMAWDQVIPRVGKCLVSQGVVPNLKNSEGKTALDIARSSTAQPHPLIALLVSEAAKD